MQPPRVCTFLAFIAVLRASEPSKRVLDYLNIVSGYYDNKEQTQEAGDDHPFVQVRLIPVDIKCLRPDVGVNTSICQLLLMFLARLRSVVCHCFLSDRLTYLDPVLFVEEALNGVIRMLNLAVIKDGIEDTVYEIIYNFTDYTKYKSGEYDVENLSSISCGDLQGDKNCNASYRVSSEGSVFGDYPLCSVTVNGKHPRFTTMHTCDTFSGTVPVNSDQPSPFEPFVLRPRRQRYPLINPPQDYVAPCGN